MQESPGRRILALAVAVVLTAFVLFQVDGASHDAGAATTTLTPTADATVNQAQPTTKLGTTQGVSISVRTIRWPGNFRLSSSAIASPSTSVPATVQNV